MTLSTPPAQASDEPMPCPFCGESPVIDGKDEYLRMRCETCGVQGQVFNFNPDSEAEIDQAEHSAVMAWNRRAEVSLPADRVQVPQNTQQAHAMLRLAKMWLQDNAAPQLSGNTGELAPRATADVERDKLPHGHRDDYYLMANARSLAMYTVHIVKTMPNWVLAMKLFATGSTSAHEICAKAGIDPDGYKVERAATKPGEPG